MEAINIAISFIKIVTMMEQHAEARSEVIQDQKRVYSEKHKKFRKLDSKIKTHEVIAAPDYLYLSLHSILQI